MMVWEAQVSPPVQGTLHPTQLIKPISAPWVCCFLLPCSFLFSFPFHSAFMVCSLLSSFSFLFSFCFCVLLFFVLDLYLLITIFNCHFPRPFSCQYPFVLSVAFSFLFLFLFILSFGLFLFLSLFLFRCLFILLVYCRFPCLSSFLFYLSFFFLVLCFHSSICFLFPFFCWLFLMYLSWPLLSSSLVFHCGMLKNNYSWLLVIANMQLMYMNNIEHSWCSHAPNSSNIDSSSMIGGVLIWGSSEHASKNPKIALLVLSPE